VGSPRTTTGVLVRSPLANHWVNDCTVENVWVTDLDGRYAEVAGVHLAFAARATVQNNALTGRAPILLSGVRQCQIQDNKLCSVTRFGGNAEAAIQGRCETVEECDISGNTFFAPAGAEAGGPTARRMIWISTGRGSISRNHLARNGPADATKPLPFGGVAGTDQNVGEMILFEGNHRTMFLGHPAAADATTVTLPATVPDTPDNRLGNVKRSELPHDAAGHETPFWPPDDWDESDEAPIHQYYVTVMAGVGWGQTRHVLKREGAKLLLDRPWRVPPTAESTVVIGLMFYRNQIVGNTCTDGMTGVQLWISAVENLIAGNTVARQRKQGIYIYGNGTTMASSMPRTWNRGLSPLFFNTVEGNTTEDCADGVMVINGDDEHVPIEFPRAIGNVIRHNSAVRSRYDGFVMVSRPIKPPVDTSPSILGTIMEFNLSRDAQNGYHLAAGADGAVLRRDLAWCWNGVPSPLEGKVMPGVGFRLDPPGATACLELNEVEGPQGVSDGRVKPVVRPTP